MRSFMLKKIAIFVIGSMVASMIIVGCGNSEPTSEPNVNKEVPAGDAVERSPGRVKDGGDK
jgi:hypothetical protein